MTIAELFAGASEEGFTDLQALIMFLVFEKQVLKMGDDSSELDLYFLEKHTKRMNRELFAYKKKMQMKYKPNVYEIEIKPKRYKTIYVLADSQVQAEILCRRMFFEPIKTTICDESLLMTRWNRKNEEINFKIKDIENKKIPSFLGGY